MVSVKVKFGHVVGCAGAGVMAGESLAYAWRGQGVWPLDLLVPPGAPGRVAAGLTGLILALVAAGEARKAQVDVAG
jgi:hypothetical protein